MGTGPGQRITAWEVGIDCLTVLVVSNSVSGSLMGISGTASRPPSQVRGALLKGQEIKRPLTTKIVPSDLEQAIKTWIWNRYFMLNN